MVETGRAFYQPGEKVRGLVSDADLLKYPYPQHNKCSLIGSIKSKKGLATQNISICDRI